MLFKTDGISVATMQSMLVRDRWNLGLFVCTVALTRFAFRSHQLYDIDSVNFALALERFNPAAHQPHPPGYFLYICLGRLLNSFLQDANLALVLLSIAASCGAVAVIYLLAQHWFGRSAASCSSALFVFSPLAWFYGTVALTYSLETLFSALLGYLCWTKPKREWPSCLWAGAVLAIAAGVRPSSLLLLGPLFLYSLRRLAWKQRLLALSVVAVAILLWFVPMIVMSGGLHVYFGALQVLWKAVPSRDTVFNSSPLTSIARAITIFFIYLLSFGAAACATLLPPKTKSTADASKRVFTTIWVLPSLCFFTLIFLKFVNSGYLLLLMPPACLWLGHSLSRWYEQQTQRRAFAIACLLLAATANTAIFLLSPFYCSYRSVRQFEAELKSLQMTLPQIAQSQTTLIIGFDAHFLGYRHAAYYLPAYLTAQYPEVEFANGPKIFAVRNRDTNLLSNLPDGFFTQFVLFPLPQQNESYRNYMETVEKRLPPKDLHTVHRNGHDFVFGPISDLPLLFPR